MDLMIGREKALLIDTGYGKGELLSEVHRLTDRPVEIAITHAHADHMGAVDELEQPLWISEDEYKWIMNDDQKEFFPKARTYFDKHSPGLLQDHQCIDLGGMVIEGIKTPGHTPGGMSFYNRTTKEMIVSDNFCPAVMVWRPLDQSLRQLNETAEKIKSMDVDCFWVGHDLRPMKGALGSLWHKAARLALDSENFTPISGTDNVFICCDEEWKKKIAGKNIGEIYRDDVCRPDFACVFIMDFFHK